MQRWPRIWQGPSLRYVGSLVALALCCHCAAIVLALSVCQADVNARADARVQQRFTGNEGVEGDKTLLHALGNLISVDPFLLSVVKANEACTAKIKIMAMAPGANNKAAEELYALLEF